MADHDRQSEGPTPGPNEVVRVRLARRVVRVGLVLRRIAEDPGRPEGAVDFIGRNMQKTKPPPRPRLQFTPVLGRGPEHRHRPLHVGSDEDHGAVDGAIHVGLGAEMDHRIRPRLQEDLPHGLTVSDVGLLETVVRLPRSNLYQTRTVA